MRFLVVAVLVLGFAPPAVADEADDARGHYQRASALYDVADYREALAEFKAAYLAKNDPVFLFNMGQCHRMLHEPAAAGNDYRAYLRRRPDAPNRDAVRKFLKATEAEESAQRAATVQPIATLTPKEEHPPAETVEPPPPPPQPIVTPPPAPIPAAATVPAPEAPAAHPSLARRWWLWAAIGAVVVAGVAIGLGIGLSNSDAAIPQTSSGYAFLPFN